jgi:hypothetical protein
MDKIDFEAEFNKPFTGRELINLIKEADNLDLPVTIFTHDGKVFPVYSVGAYYTDRIEINTGTEEIDLPVSLPEGLTD